MNNSYNGSQPAAADPHGQAALCLVESLIHGLTANSVLSVADAVTIIEVALDAQTCVADEMAPSSQSARAAAELLSRMVASLRTDLLGGAAPQS